LARSLLKEAGYTVQKGKIIGPAGPFSFRFLFRAADALRMAEPFRNNLAKLGIEADLDFKDRSIFLQKLWSHDFDVTALHIPSGASPGKEQKYRWHSSLVSQKRSQNSSGLANKAVDSLLELLIASKTSEEHVLATKCLDRVIYHLHLAVQNWYTDTYFVALWNKYSRPAKLPSFYYEYDVIEFMWLDTMKEKRLNNAMRKGEKI
jgi:microcin C transport system substrate-binding protein